jgi:hypothetical protein
MESIQQSATRRVGGRATRKILNVTALSAQAQAESDLMMISPPSSPVINDNVRAICFL